MPPPSRSVLSAVFAALTVCQLTSCRENPSSPQDSPPGPEPVSYTFQVRPILARNCFGCHGRDEQNNPSGIRLDSAEFAFQPFGDETGSPRHPWVPGQREKSAAWQLLTAASAGDLATKSAAAHQLPTSNLELIGQWIDEGARYEPHWAFEPIPEKVPAPNVSPAGWPKSEVDRFVLARLQREGLQPAPEAAPEILLRRLALALTGLPPTLDQIRAIRGTGLDPSSDQGAASLDAILESAADRLLASPAFAEHLAAHWLETAAYADPIAPGHEQLTNRWLYRDWVVEAFRENLPIDQFLTAQLAGDLPTAVPRQEIATAFNRLHALPADGLTGAEARRGNQATRASHLGSTVLGLSLECARCHDHKTDPVSQDDFLAVASCFELPSENGLATPGVPPAPTLARPTRDQFEHLARLQHEADEAEQRLTGRSSDDEAAFHDWLDDPLKLAVINDAAGIFTFDRANKTVQNQALTGSGTGDASGLQFGDGFSGGAVRFDGSAGATFQAVMPLRRWTPWSFTLRFRTSELPGEPVVLLSRGRGAVDRFHGFDLLLEGGRITARFAREWPGNAIGIRTAAEVVVPNQWHMLTWTYDGSSSAEGMRLFLDGQPAATTVLADSLWKLAFPKKEDEKLPLRLGWRPGANGFAGGAIDDFQVHRRALTALEAATLHDGMALADALASYRENLPALRDYYYSSIHPRTRQTRAQLTSARRAAILPEEEIVEIAVMAGGPPAPAELPRFLQAGDLPSAAEPTSARSRLAQAVVRHPLTARVFVNRVWEFLFGEGLVATPDDFGLSGASPSHPKLLEWLGRDFIDHGWDLHHLCKRIVLSATFRQASRPPETMPDEPGVRSLAHGPSFELPAKTVRDVVLQTAGLLDLDGGGPPDPNHSSSRRRSLYLIHDYPPVRPARPASTGEDDQPAQCPIDYQATPPAAPGPALSEEHLRSAYETLLRETADLDDDVRFRLLALQIAGILPSEKKTSEALAELQALRSTVSPITPGGPVQKPLSSAESRQVWLRFLAERFDKPFGTQR